MPKRMKATPSTAVLAAVIEEDDTGAIVIARVVDPSKLLDRRSRALHKDVVDVLVDLAIELLDRP